MECVATGFNLSEMMADAVADGGRCPLYSLLYPSLTLAGSTIQQRAIEEDLKSYFF